ncbi:NAD(P)/FAD-dependent oxidoreductase [Actinoallomurus acaciae]|uniref:NAD(P)/FAD-dependent oxidoreductase n=1 Tax=Actinoallomurus acaciae TaxID=502577 RepID=A0ABV5YFY9_9ACTN
MRENCDVAVVGAGVVGLATAFELLTRGLTVTLIGPRGGDHAGQATRAAGAMLSTFSEIEPHHDEHRVILETTERVTAHEMYPAWLETVGGHAGRRLTATLGTWVLAPAGKRAWLNPIAGAAHAAGHPAEQHDATDIPGLAAPPSSAAALWLPTEARIDSSDLVEALTHAVTDHPRAEWRDTQACAVGSGRVRCTDGTQVSAADVVLAAGAGIPALLPEAGRPIGVPPILAGRGVSALLRAPAVAPPHVVRTPNAAFACGVHLVPRADGTQYLGGTNRLTMSPETDRRASLDELSVLIGDATGLLDHRLSGAELLAVRVGLRPYTLDHLPLIGRTGERSLLLATATYRCGVLLAPRLAALVADEVTEPGALEAHPYRVLRPMAVPNVEDVIADGAAHGLVEHLLQGGGHFSPTSKAQLDAFLALALRALLTDQRDGAAALRRLWQAAPVPEVLPSLLAMAQRSQALR